jgi:molybdenum cofactor biosynthesis enzyme MoaA
MPRVILKVGYRCNNRCGFCHSAGLRGIRDLDTQALLERLEEARAGGFDGVVLSGGEPTLRRDLLRLAGRARELGLAFGLISNGRMLSYPALADALATAGLEYAYLSLHAADAAVHDALVGVRGAHAQSLQGIRNLAVHPGVRVTVNAVVVRDNLRFLGPLMDLLAQLPGVRVKLSSVEPRGAMGDRPDEIPRAEDTAAAVRDALAHGLDLGLPRGRLAWDGLPFCHMEGWLDRFADLYADDLVALREADEAGFPPVDYRNMTHGPACAACGLSGRCRGTWIGTWELYPDTRVAPRSADVEP